MLTSASDSYNSNSSKEIVNSKKLREMVLQGISVDEVSYPKKIEPKFPYFCGPSC
jgi:hypothetical protein